MCGSRPKGWMLRGKEKGRWNSTGALWVHHWSKDRLVENSHKNKTRWMNAPVANPQKGDEIHMYSLLRMIANEEVVNIVCAFF